MRRRIQIHFAPNRCFAAGIILAACLSGTSASAETRPVLQSDDFQSVVITSLYSTAFGAAAGAALLPFLPGSPSSNVRFVTGGASLGFLLGSAIGFYNLSQAFPAYAHPASEESVPGYGTSDYPPGEAQTYLSAPPGGALLSGVGSQLRVGMPQFAIGENWLTVSLLNLRF